MRTFCRGLPLVVAIGVLALGCERQSASTPTPEPARTASVPPAASPKPQDGAALYRQFCANCHGLDGKGGGPAAAALPVRPADHTDGAVMGKLSDADVFRVIKDGGQAVGKSPVMPRWGGILTDAQIQALVAHVRNLAKAQ